MKTYLNPNTFPVHPGAGAPVASGGLVELQGDEEWLEGSIEAGELVETKDRLQAPVDAPEARAGAASGDDGDVSKPPRAKESKS